MYKYCCIILISSFTACKKVSAQTSVLDAGIRLQKAVNLYYENGLSINYSDKRLKPDRLYFGLSYVTSRLGSAMGSNAIKQDNFLLSSSYFFRKDHLVRPFLRGNVGFFTAEYGDPKFDDLPSSSALLSADGGVSFQTKIPLKISASLGYNLITGDGLSGPGTLYPVFYQVTFSWNLFHKDKLEQIK